MPRIPMLRAVIILALVTGAGRVARAEEPAPFIASDRAASDRADDLTKQALVLAKADRWKEAEPLLREAWGLKHSYDIAGNLGIVETELERWRDAAEHLTYAFKTFPGNGKPEQKKRLEMTLAKVLPRVAVLKVQVDGERADVFVDGRGVGATPLAEMLFLEPGRHRITAKRAGYTEAGQEVVAVQGQSTDVALTLRPERPQTSRPPLGVMIVIPSLGVAGLAIGAGLAAAANGKGSDAAKIRSMNGGTGSACLGTPTAANCKALHDDGAAQTALSNASVGTFVAGGVLALTSAGLGVWFLTARSDPSKRVGTVRLVPTVGSHEGGVVAVGQW